MDETVPFISDEDFILADILERSANNDEDINSHTNSIYFIIYETSLLFHSFLDNQSIFRPLSPANTTECNPVVVTNEQKKIE